MTDLKQKLMDKLQRAEDEINNIAQGKREWTMSIPAREATDTDLLLQSVVDIGRGLIDILVQQREALEFISQQLKSLDNNTIAIPAKTITDMVLAATDEALKGLGIKV